MSDLSALSPEARRWFWAGVVVVLYALFCLAIALRETWRGRRARQAASALSQGSGEPVLVAYASQTGFAEELATATAKALSDAGAPVTLKDLSAVTAGDLAGRALFLVSTTGEGDAPDPARAFIRDVMKTKANLSALRYGVLALGDSSYAHYCAFGRSLDAWLAGQGAQPLFDRVEVDDADPAALRHWQVQLATLTGVTHAPDWTRPIYDIWTLGERTLLNPGSPGGEAWHVRLTPPKGADWQAGDILEIGPRNDPAQVAALVAALDLPTQAAETLAGLRLPPHDGDLAPLRGLSVEALAQRLTPLPHREYSIASLPGDGGVELIVRLMPRADGALGLGSGWLCRYAPIGAAIEARVRVNRSFHAPETTRPLILIGAGTGLAGLRAHLKARAAAGVRWNWLVFGERTAAHDYFHRAELEAWKASGLLDRLDLAFSRDQAERIYVQHRLRESADILRRWVANGAAIYVCGSLEGMSREVHSALVQILGAEGLERLTDQGRYRRDVY
ncbi:MULTISPECIES: sulfite reductase flavoprotein subunit alpha [unclassified Caulobacter]|uniref:sulfite reductase subunit alpha n=1 Tax=unclassified Caulobacter TaxID=2648921 RepID=UPI0007814240|nr:MULTISPECIES: sulfite reductase flavoprotein subunit alpha [unclassified Caulobacter]AZS20255.1 sulfite reductase flavoprotein subunit alpha [Caulobacter sp. FWC26]